MRIFFIFISAFFLNAAWEYAHSFLYAHYRGGAITGVILLRAAFFDAIVITVLGLIFLRVSYLRNRPWLLIVVGVLFAVLLERYALITGRWAYTSAMPLIPFIGTGLTPTIQLGFLAYVILQIGQWRYHR